MQRLIVLFFFISLFGCISQQNEVSSSTDQSKPTLDGDATSSNLSNVDNSESEECPFGKINDSYPGSCGRYVDLDNNGICDLSQ
jgi:hypothetical protein